MNNNLYHKRIRKIAAYFTLLVMSAIFIVGYGAEPEESTSVIRLLLFKGAVTLILIAMYQMLKRTGLLKEIE